MDPSHQPSYNFKPCHESIDDPMKSRCTPINKYQRSTYESGVKAEWSRTMVYYNVFRVVINIIVFYIFILFLDYTNIVNVVSSGVSAGVATAGAAVASVTTNIDDSGTSSTSDTSVGGTSATDDNVTYDYYF